ncbi:MAG: glycosyltransferase [Cyanobacteria bacterium P01_D01_bin.105]
MKTPLVSILLNNYNYGRFLKRAIDSALEQTYPYVEVVVTDDGSTDCSRDIIERYGDAIVSVLKPNGGQDSAFNAGFAKSQGDIVCFFDSDDSFVPHKIQTIVDTFNQNPEISWCFHALKLLNHQTGKTVGKTHAFPGQTEDISTYCDFRQDMRWGRLPYYPSPTSGLCLRRSLANQILPMQETFVNTHADCYVRCAAMAAAPGFFLTDELTHQYLHDSNCGTLGDERPVIEEKELVAACLLRANFPEVSLYANRVFVRAYSTFLTFQHEIEPNYQTLVDWYWSMCSPLDKLIIKAATFYRLRLKPTELDFIEFAPPDQGAPQNQQIQAIAPSSNATTQRLGLASLKSKRLPSDG